MKFDDSKYNALDREFVLALDFEDTLGLIVRTHLYVEAALNRFLLFYLHCQAEDDFRKVGLSFSQKILLAKAMRPDVGVWECLQKMNSIRNKFAHRLDADLQSSEVDALFRMLPREQRELAIKLAHDLKLIDAAEEHQFVGQLDVRAKYKYAVLSLERRLHWTSTPVDVTFEEITTSPETS